MANRTSKDAATVKGTNPQFLVEKIIRQRIYDSVYWKEHCFALSAELIVDKGMELRFLGGIYAGNIKPTPFLCLLLKMLQIQPDKDIAVEFIKQEDFKYLRCLGAMYIRLTVPSVECYKLLEPLYNDYRKIRWMNKMGKFELLHMDEFIDGLVKQERYCDIQLPRLQKREALEEVKELEGYKSLLDEDLDKLSSSSSDSEDEKDKKKERPKLVSRRRDRSRERERNERDMRIEYSPERNRKRRSRSREREDRKEERGGGGDRRMDRERERERERGGGGDRREDRRDRDRERRRDDDRRRESGRGDREKGRSDGRKRGNDDEQREIDEANALRAKLGMAPLEK